MVREELAQMDEKVTGQYKVSPKVQMHWGMDKVVIISGNKRVVLNRKEMKSLMKGVKANKLTEGTCGYGENGQIGEEPAGPHLIKKKKIKEKKLNEAKPYETILKQLGGNRFIAMTGAKNLGTNGKDLSFSIGRNAKKVTHVHIKLTSMDLYDVEFINMRGAKRKVIKKVKGVYGDMLPKIFQKYTGMRTRL
jgi:hypothetical protein